jgi:uncharacterized protein YraI
MRISRVVLPLLAAAASLAPFGASEAFATPAPAMRYIPANGGNYTARASRRIDRIVVHTVEGSEQGCISWFQNPASNVSAHFVVSHAGRVTRMLRDSDIGWHAGNWDYNTRSIGIENEGYAYRNTWTDAQIRVLAQLIAYLCETYGIPKDRNHIIGHKEVPGATHTDPGPHLDWNRLMDLVRGGAAAPAPQNPPPAKAPPASGGRGAEVTASRLNVRNGPWGTILGSITTGKRFVLTGQASGEWRQIFWGGHRAWVHGSYIRGAGGAGSEVTVDTLNVRTGPSTGNARIGVTHQGQRYFHHAWSGSWRRIQFDDRQGWSHGGYTRSVNVGN